MSPLPRDHEERCWCDARAAWFTGCYQDDRTYLCDDHKLEAEAMPENEGVEFHRVGDRSTSVPPSTNGDAP